MQPIPEISPEEFEAWMPEAARSDLTEWGPAPTPEAMATAILAGRVPISSLTSAPGRVPAITDDRPYNEYFLLRRTINFM